MRSTLGAAMQCIRFPCMNLQEYADCVCPTDMLNVNETNNIFLYLTATQKPAVEYPTVPRLGMKPITCHRFQSSAYRYVVIYIIKIGRLFNITYLDLISGDTEADVTVFSFVWTEEYL